MAKQSKSRRKKGSSNRTAPRKKQPSIYDTAPMVEPRTCICPLHEQFWVTPSSPQQYALPACRKRAYDRVKKVAFRQFMYDGLRRIGMAARVADELAHRAMTRFYTKFVALLKQLGWVYNPEKATWVKA